MITRQHEMEDDDEDDDLFMTNTKSRFPLQPAVSMPPL